MEKHWTCDKCTNVNPIKLNKCSSCTSKRKSNEISHKIDSKNESVSAGARQAAECQPVNPHDIIGREIVYKLIDDGDEAWMAGTVKAKAGLKTLNNHSYRIVFFDDRTMVLDISKTTKGLVWDYLETNTRITKEELECFSHSFTI